MTRPRAARICRRHHRDDDRRLLRAPRPKWRASSAPSRATSRTATDMLRVMRNHRSAAHGDSRRLRAACRSRRCRSTPRLPGPAPRSARPAPRGTTPSRSARSTATATPRSSVIAPTGTIGLVMDCDTTGIEPDFALVKFKKLAGGGYFKIINRAVPEALRTLGYAESADRRDRGLRRRPRHAQPGARGINHSDARAPRASPTKDRRARSRPRHRLRHQVRLQPVDAGRRLPAARLGVTDAQLDDPSFDLLAHLGFSKKDIEARQHPCLRRDDPRGRARSSRPSTCRCSTAPIPAARSASATSRSRATSG